MTHFIFMVAVFIIAFIIGYFLISRVPALLHTPLMSMTNAISAATILGALTLFAQPLTGPFRLGALAAIIAATFNVVGGFAITGRMLRLFKEKGARKDNP